MDVRNRARLYRLILLAVCLHLLTGATANADPIYTAIDLGTGSPTYGVDSSGNGTVTGSNGLTYTFNPVQNYLPAQWSNTTQGVPLAVQAPVNDPDTNGNPKFAYSYSNLNYMNSQGLATGIDYYGVEGHLGNGEVFVTQQQANRSWGTPIQLWSGASNFAVGEYGVGIMGVSPYGQVLGYGAANPSSWPGNTLYLYDTKTQAVTNLTNLIDSLKWTDSTQLPMGQGSNWLLNSVVSVLDDQGRILIQAIHEGDPGTVHNVLLIPQGISSDPAAVPEPESWAVFATLVVGWIAHERHRARARTRS